jgi:hypothetical protein
VNTTMVIGERRSRRRPATPIDPRSAVYLNDMRVRAAIEMKAGTIGIMKGSTWTDHRVPFIKVLYPMRSSAIERQITATARRRYPRPMSPSSGAAPACG